MTSNVLRYGGRFLFLTAFQVLILNNIQLFGYLNPYLYILFVLVLPPNINRSLLLLLAFLSGWTIDIFENSGGIHASASVFIAFIRPTLLRYIVPRVGSELDRISLWGMGGGRFFTYIGTSVLLHHLWLFSLEAFALREVFSILSRTFISVPITMLMIYITQLFVYREEQ